jgi:Protein of unknown function (DUF1176)
VLNLLLLLAATPVAPSVVSPRPEITRTFKDWTVGCDNHRFCMAMSLEAADGTESQAPVTIYRAPGPNALVKVTIDVSMFKDFQLTVDDEWVLHRSPDAKAKIRYCGDDAHALIQKMADADHILVRDPGDPTSRSPDNHGRTSLAGLKAALLYMDDQQGRVDTSTALIRPGTKTISNASLGYSVTLVRPPASKKTPRRISPQALQKLNDGHGCSSDQLSQNQQPISARLDADNSLFVVHWACGGGAYNFFADTLIVDEQGNMHTARFDIGAGMTGEEVGNIMVNARWIAPLRLLESFEIGRGMGDCGRRRRFVWDGEMFRLAQQEEMNECRGAAGFIQTFNANVFDRKN